MANIAYGVSSPLFPYKTDLGSISGLNKISVAPEYQRQGIGSMLLQWGCDKADSCGWNSFVMAFPMELNYTENSTSKLWERYRQSMESSRVYFENQDHL